MLIQEVCTKINGIYQSVLGSSCLANAAFNCRRRASRRPAASLRGGVSSVFVFFSPRPHHIDLFSFSVRSVKQKSRIKYILIRAPSFYLSLWVCLCSDLQSVFHSWKNTQIIFLNLVLQDEPKGKWDFRGCHLVIGLKRSKYFQTQISILGEITHNSNMQLLEVTTWTSHNVTAGIPLC